MSFTFDAPAPWGDDDGVCLTAAGRDAVEAAPHAFNAAVDATLSKAQAISNQRAGEYADSWALDNIRTPFLDHILGRVLGVSPIATPTEVKRLLVVAALIDVKDSRMLGPWKSDTVEDGINYRAAFRTWMDEWHVDAS